MFELKPIARESVPRALSKAERYRLLNESREAESICLDILRIEPGNQAALACLILSLTDLFGGLHGRADEVRPLIARLGSEYDRAYYAGVIEERWGKALLQAGYPNEATYEFFRSAMRHYEAADALADAGNDDATLRWNACVRIMERHGLVPPEHSAAHEPGVFDGDVPLR